MAINVLVVTQDNSLGEFIRQSLEETGKFHVRVTREARKAVSFLLETDCTLAFIDSGKDGEEMLAMGHRLRETRPALRFVVITEAGWHLALEELSPEDHLSKPFTLPDLLDTVGRLYPERTTPEQPPGGEALDGEMPPWLSNVNRAAQHLTRLTLESSAQAALITNQDHLWAYAGQLPQAAARELAAVVTRYWDRGEENDLVRFVRLVSTDAEHMLYATRLAAGMVLALVFDAETPFSTIRTQANQLAHSLSDVPGEDEPGNDEQDLPVTPRTDFLPDIQPGDPGLPVGPAGMENAGMQVNRVKETVRRLFSPGRISETEEDQSMIGEDLPLQTDRDPDRALPFNHLSAEYGQNETRSSYSLPEVDELAVTSKTQAARKAETAVVQDDQVETHPSPIPEGARKIVLEPVTPAVYNLDYVCLLLPRFTHHHLTGDLSEHLGEWVAQICIAFGWRLEFISVRPEYFMGIVNVPPSASPGTLMRLLRQHTSEKIFAEFPRFSKENPSGDFWAPGYLIMGGSQPPPPQLIKDYIAQTRHHQGIAQPYRR